MVDITYFDHLIPERGDLEFEDLVELTKGNSIKSMALADDFIEFGLSDGYNLRIQGHFAILLVSTLNKDELPPVRLQIISEKETPTAAVVEQRIHALRQLYAANFLVNAGRAEELAKALKDDSKTDLEELLSADERLFVSAASEGSFWLTVATKTGTAFKALSNIIPLFYVEGGTALLERVRAKTDLAKLAVEEKRAKVAFDQANEYFDLVQKVTKIKDPWARQQAELAMSSSLRALGKEPLALPPPSVDNKKDDEI
jgi:hypothetical protein